MKKLTYSKYKQMGVGYVVDKTKTPCSVELHNHDFYEVELVLSSRKTQHVLNGTCHELQKGSVYIINPSDIHSFDVEEGGYFERYNVRFKQDAVSEKILATVINNNCLCNFGGGDFDALVKLFEVIEYFYKHPTAATSEISAGVIESMILMIRDRSSSYVDSEESKRKSQIQRILLYLHKNFRNNISLAEVAKHSSFSPHYVSQLFHAETNMTLTQYVTKLRLEYAKNLLLSTDHSIGEICEKCGFGSFAHFLRNFKNAYGESPARYRRILRAENKSQQ